MGCQQMKSKKCSVVILRDLQTSQIIHDKNRMSIERDQTQATPQNQNFQFRNTETNNRYQLEILSEAHSQHKIDLGEQTSKFGKVVANMSPNSYGCIQGSTPKAKSLEQLMKQKQAILEAEFSNLDILSQKKLEAKIMIKKEQQSQFETLKQIF